MIILISGGEIIRCSSSNAIHISVWGYCISWNGMGFFILNPIILKRTYAYELYYIFYLKKNLYAYT